MIAMENTFPCSMTRQGLLKSGFEIPCLKIENFLHINSSSESSPLLSAISTLPDEDDSKGGMGDREDL